MSLFLFWVFCIILGMIIGQKKGQLASGIVWSVLFGIFGVIIVLCLPNRKKEAEAKAHKAEEEKRWNLQQEQLRSMQKELAQRSHSPPPPPGAKGRIRVAKDGEELGELTVTEVRGMLSRNELSLEDYFFETRLNEWLTLDCHPDIT
jgi:hypothetical protein